MNTTDTHAKLARTRFNIFNGLSCLLLLAVLLASILPATAWAQDNQSPVGRWFANGYGFAIDFYVEPTVDGTSFAIIGLVHAPADGPLVCASNPSALVDRMCEKVDKDGPFAIGGQIERVSAAGDFVAMYDGAFTATWLGQDFPIRMAFFANELGRLQHTGTRRGREHVSSVNLTRTDEKPSPLAQWAAGNWVADFGTLRLEAAISAGAPGSISGTFQALPAQGAWRDIPSTAISNWVRVVEDYYPFAMTMRAELSSSGSLYEGLASTPAEYTEIYQEAQIRLLPFENIAIVAQFENMDRQTFGEPFLFVGLDGPLTPVSIPGATNLATDPSAIPGGGSGEQTTTLATDPSAIPDGGSSEQTAQASETSGPLGEWRAVEAYIYNTFDWPGRNLSAGVRPGDTVEVLPATLRVIAQVNPPAATLESPTGSQSGTLRPEQDRQAALISWLEREMTSVSSGGSALQWLGSQPTVHGIIGNNIASYLFVGANRAILAIERVDRCPPWFTPCDLGMALLHGSMLGSVSADILLLERVGSLATPSGTAQLDPQAQTSSQTDPQSGPQSDPSTGQQSADPSGSGSNFAETFNWGESGLGGTQSEAQSGARMLVGGADMNNACAALMAIEAGLWAGAQDGFVSLTDLRNLSMIMYANGVRDSGMTNQAACTNVIIMMAGALN